MTTEDIKNQLRQLARAADELCGNAQIIEGAAQLCLRALRNGHKVMFCGNGGSAAQAQHLAAELVGRCKMNRPALSALSLTVDTSNITAIANDYAFEEIFARQLEGIGREGDVLIGLSTSGNSRNVLLAFDRARRMGITTIAFVGSNGGEMTRRADFTLTVPTASSAHIQELHLAAGHLMCDYIESTLYA